MIKISYQSGETVTSLLTVNSYNVKEIGDAIFSNLQQIQGIRNNTLVYSYNEGIPKTKLNEISTWLQSMKGLFNYSSIKGVIDNTLEISGISRTSDIRSKIIEMCPNKPDTVIELIEAKINRILEQIGEVNELLRTHAKDKESVYSMKHHFPSPKGKELYKKTTDTQSN